MTWLLVYLIGAGLSLLMLDAWGHSEDGRRELNERPVTGANRAAALALYAALWPITVAWGVFLCLRAWRRGEFAVADDVWPEEEE